MPEPLDLFFSIVYGIIGMGYFAYGKKDNLFFLLAGICLMVFTFAVSDTQAMIWSGAALVVAPFILTKYL